MWRVRMLVQHVVTYFLWLAIFSGQSMLFGYTQSMMLTYVLLSVVIRPLTLGTRTQDVGTMINNGSLSNYLVRPIHFFTFLWSRDITDKIVNIFFAIIEIVILIVLLKPQVFVQTNFVILLLVFFSATMGIVLFFYFSLLLSLLGFWTSDIWAPRFFSFVLVEFFAGNLFPLDILPNQLFVFSSFLPFGYFVYFPLKIYIGQLTSTSLLQGFLIGIVWIAIFKIITDVVWSKGLKVYTAEGR